MRAARLARPTRSGVGEGRRRARRRDACAARPGRADDRASPGASPPISARRCSSAIRAAGAAARTTPTGRCRLVFAGKAHPDDKPGQDFIRQVYQFSRQPEFERQGRLPRRLRHRHGAASGQRLRRVAQHADPPARGQRHQRAEGGAERPAQLLDPRRLVGGGLRRHERLGHSASEREYADDATRDEADATALYDDRWSARSCRSIFDRGLDDVPHNWVAVMKEAIRTVRAANSACAAW